MISAFAADIVAESSSLVGLVALAWLVILTLAMVAQGIALWSIYKLSVGVVQYRFDVREHEKLHWHAGRDVVEAIAAAGRVTELVADSDKKNRALIEAQFSELAGDLRALTIAIKARAVRHDDLPRAERPATPPAKAPDSGGYAP